MTQKLICKDWRHCRWKGKEADLLRAPSPFDPETEITACPKCKEIGGCMVACQVEECWKEATCGINTPDGYKHVCYEHFAHFAKLEG